MNVLDRFRLDGKVALVTGGSSGLGVSFACALAEAGADVAVVARRADRLAQTQEKIQALGRRAIAIEADITDLNDCDVAVATTVDELGGIDILVNNAGIGDVRPFLREAPKDFMRVLEVNLAGCAWMARAAAEKMSSGGAIVNVSSVASVTTVAGAPQASYASAKAGLLGLTRDLAHQWSGRRRIRVNALSPGFFATEMTDEYTAGIEKLLPRIPLGRAGDPAELAAALVFLVSDAGAYVTGENLIVDGGFVTG